MIQFNLSMTPIYKMEYDMHMISKEDLHQYVVNQWLTPEGYKEILGEQYVANA